MKHDPSESAFILSSGRRLAENGRYRLSLNQTTDAICYGYDGFDARTGPDADRPFTPEERREVADYMVDAWERWAATGDVSGKRKVTP